MSLLHIQLATSIQPHAIQQHTDTMQLKTENHGMINLVYTVVQCQGSIWHIKALMTDGLMSYVPRMSVQVLLALCPKE